MEVFKRFNFVNVKNKKHLELKVNGSINIRGLTVVVVMISSVTTLRVSTTEM